MHGGLLFAAAQIAAAASPAAVEGPSAATLEARLPSEDLGCFDGFVDRRTRQSFGMCLTLTPHVQRLVCRDAPDLGGRVCDYAVDYFDDLNNFTYNEPIELRSELFARDPESPSGWRFVREIVPLRTEPRSRRRRQHR